RGIKPGYEQLAFSDVDKKGKLKLVASPTGEDGSVTIHSDAKLYATILDDNERAQHALGKRKAWVHVARGRMKVNGAVLREGDAVAVAEEDVVLEGLSFQGSGGEALLFDLP
ncbi:MAG TPA: quercetin 2,3-dioxygenase, partial [Myxococcota bacterium]